jgi:hypothetical protein
MHGGPSPGAGRRTKECRWDGDLGAAVIQLSPHGLEAPNGEKAMLGDKHALCATLGTNCDLVHPCTPKGVVTDEGCGGDEQTTGFR